MITDAQVQLFTDQVADALERLDRLERRQLGQKSPVKFAAYQTTSQNMPTGWTPITLDTVIRDSAGGFTAPSDRYVCQVAGDYVATGLVGWTSGGTSFRAGKFTVNGAEVPGSGPNLPADSDYTSVPLRAVLVPMQVGDYIQLLGYTPGATSTGVTYVPYRSRLDLWRIG